MPYSNPITISELSDINFNNPLHPRDGSPVEVYMPPAYFMVPPATTNGPVKWRLFDAAYITTGIIDPNRLGTGSTGAGNLYLADDGTWKAVSSGGGGGDMLKATYDVDNDGVVDSAERTEIIVRNSTGTTLTKGTIVYLSGATGNRPNAVRAQANTEATSSKTIGIVVSNISNNSDGYVATNGTLHDLDTSAFTAGDAVWLSAATAGAFTSTIPAEPNHTVFIGYVARAHPTQGRIVILIQNGYELNELHGVLVTSEANNDLLVYETSTTLWKNKSISTIFGGTPLVSVPTLAQVTTAGNTTTNSITVGAITGNDGTVAQVKFSSGASALTPTMAVGNTGAGGKFAGLIAGTVGSAFIFDSSGYFVIAGDTKANYTSNNLGGSSSVYLSVFNTGNVVISPTPTDAGYKLDVNGTVRAQNKISIIYSDNAYNGGLLIRNTNTGTNSLCGFNFADSAGNLVVEQIYYPSNFLPSPYANSVAFNSMGQQRLGFTANSRNSGSIAQDIYFSTLGANSTYQLQIKGNGNVQINTNTDSGYRLDVNGTFRAQGNSLIKTSSTASNVLGFEVQNSAGTIAFQIYNDGQARFYNNLTCYSNIIANDILARNVGITLNTNGVRSTNFIGNVTASSALAQGVYFNNTLVAAANNDVLVGLDINPTFTNGAFTGVANWGLRVQNRVLLTRNDSSSNGSLYIQNTSTTGSNNIQIGEDFSTNFMGFGWFPSGSGTFNSLVAKTGYLYILAGASQMSFNTTTATQPITFSTNNWQEKMRIFGNGNVNIGGGNFPTDTGQKLQVSGKVFIKGTTSLTATKVFEVQNGAGESIMDFRDNQYAFFGCGQGGGSATGFIFNYSNTSYCQFSGYNYGAGAGAYKPILLDTDIVGRGNGVFVNFGVSTNPPPDSDTEFGVRGRTADSSTFIARFRESGNTDRFEIRADGALFTNTLQGYSGTLSIPTNPPGSNTITITNGLITNIA